MNVTFSTPSKVALVSGALLCFLGVLLGAFGAHALSELLIQNDRLTTFATASEYHFLHGLALMIIGLIPIQETQHKALSIVCFLMLIGVLVFSGSLYLLAVTDIAWLGAITPVGGIMLLLAWAMVIKLSLNIKA